MKMINGLTKANIKNTGIELAPEYDFTDDGSKFRGFIYKGMPMTQCRSDGECYLCIRVDYLRDNQFTWNEWRETEEYHLEDEFNGVSQFDLDKLIENLEKIIAKVNEMNTAASAEEINMTEVIEKANQEIKDLENFLESVKTNLKWWTLDGYKLKNAKDCLDSLIKELERSKKIDFESLDRMHKKSHVERLKNYHYVIIKKGYYMETLEEYMN